MTALYDRDLARIHHEGFGGLARSAAPGIVAALRRAGFAAGRVVDLGCGSGILLAELLAAGYQATGVDASEAMLALARDIAPGADLVLGSLHDATIPPAIAVLAVGEGLTYLPSRETPAPDWGETFARVAAALPAGGLFAFDLLLAGRDSERPYRSWTSGDDWAVLVEVRSIVPGRTIERAITTFRRAGDGWRRSDAIHAVRLVTAGEVLLALRRAGFAAQLRRSYWGARVGPGRRVFLARKRGSERGG